VVGNSIVTVFPATQDGLAVTQTITVAGTSAATSVIEHNVKVVNNNANPQQIAVRYLWDTMVGGYDGTWLQQYNGATAGAITGYETDYNPPASTFTSYGMGGCSQGTVVPPPFTCLPVNFGSASGTFTVYGSISSGPGATTPSRFVYGYWGALFGTDYAYTVATTNEIGSYVPNNDGGQDSAMLYYFPTQTIPNGGSLSDQADISDVQSAVVPPTVTTQLSSSAITAGNSVTDQATLAGGNSPTGTMSFYYSSSNTCPNGNGIQVGTGVTVAGNGVYTSVSQTFSTPGTYYWYAAYSGDSNNAPATSACEPLVVTASGTPSITLAPLTASNPVGTSHTVTATVLDGTGAALAGVTVTFTVSSGPNAGATGTGVTGATGKATFTYSDTGGVGMDTIVATFHDATGLLHTSNTVTKTWTSTTHGVPEFGGAATLASALGLLVVALMARRMRPIPAIPGQ